MAKLFVSAVVEWIEKRPFILVSAELSTGQPAAHLEHKNFIIGLTGRAAATAWRPVSVQVVNVTGDSHGFYTLYLNPLDSLTSWESSMSNFVFTVEAVDGQDRGQCLATNKCCGDDGTDDTPSFPPKGVARTKVSTSKPKASQSKGKSS
jgi:hypothetical protein